MPGRLRASLSALTEARRETDADAGRALLQHAGTVEREQHGRFAVGRRVIAHRGAGVIVVLLQRGGDVSAVKGSACWHAPGGR